MIKHLPVTQEVHELKGVCDAKAHAARLAFVRQYIGFDRHKFSELLGVHYVSLKRWESGSYHLPEKRMLKIIDVLEEFGLKITFDWLKFGKGTPPVWTEERIITDELEYFATHMPNNVALMIDNDAMMPKYCKGDAVGGTKFADDQIELAVDKFCIVELFDGTRMVCKLRKSMKPGCYNLELLHSDLSPTGNVVIVDVKLKFIAPIKWHRSKHFIG